MRGKVKGEAIPTTTTPPPPPPPIKTWEAQGDDLLKRRTRTRKEKEEKGREGVQIGD